jgi:hypothetical protein
MLLEGLCELKNKFSDLIWNRTRVLSEWFYKDFAVKLGKERLVPVCRGRWEQSLYESSVVSLTVDTDLD